MDPRQIAKIITEDPDVMSEAIIEPELPDLEWIIGPYLHQPLPRIENALNRALEPYRIRFIKTADFIRIAEENGLAPPPREGPGVYTAATSPINGDIFILYNPRHYAFIPAVKMIEDMLEHELVHRAQVERGASDTVDPSDKESYLSNKQEMMAFAKSVASGLKDFPPLYVKDILRGEEIEDMGQFAMPWQRLLNMYRDVGGEPYRRFLRYLYDYLVSQGTIE